MLMLGVPIADNDDQAVAVSALVRLAPSIVLVRGRPDRAVALVGSSLDLEPALAAFTPADRIVVDRSVEAEMTVLDLITHFGERSADLVVGWDLRFHGFMPFVKG